MKQDFKVMPIRSAGDSSRGAKKILILLIITDSLETSEDKILVLSMVLLKWYLMCAVALPISGMVSMKK